MAIVQVTITPCTRVIDGMSKSRRGAVSSPACGPEPVTSVPATIAATVPATTAQTRRTAVGDGARPGSRSDDTPGDDHEVDHQRCKGQQQMTLDRDRVEVDAHRDSAQHGVGGDQRDQRPRQADEATPRRRDSMGQDGDGAGRRP